MTLPATQIQPTGTVAPSVIHLDVIGLPAPQGSKTRMPNGAMVEAGSKTGRAKLKSWRAAVTETAMAWKEAHPDVGQMTGPLEVEISFRFPPVASSPHRYRHATKPDLDKLVRSVFDPLTHAGLIRDDCQIYSLTATKHYVPAGAFTGAQITVRDHSSEEERAAAWSKELAKAARAKAKAARNA